MIGRTKGGLNSKLHVLADAKGRPIQMFLSAGQTSDYLGARALLSSIPEAGALLADRGYDGLCCTNRVRDSSRESSVLAGVHEQTDTPDLQDQELARL